MGKILVVYNILKLSQIEINSLDRSITRNEIETVIKTLTI